MKRWIQIAIISILIAVVANIGYLNNKIVSLKREILCTQYGTILSLNHLFMVTWERDNNLYNEINNQDIDFRNRLSKLEKELHSPKIPDIVESVIKSVVFIEVTGKVEDPRTGELIDAGYKASGSFLDKEGHILTAGHVVAGIYFLQDPKVVVTCYDGKKFEGVAFASTNENFLKDPGEVLDLGVIKIANCEGMDILPIQLAENNPRLGETLIVVGHPLNHKYSVTSGIVSRLSSFQEGDPLLLQTDAAVNPGNSGCPLFGLDGKVYGIASFMQRKANNFVLEGLNFAVPVSEIRKNISLLMEKLTVN